jgi:TIR domain
VSRIFLSHSSADNAAAVALRDWLVAEGWNDLFLDLDPQRGLKAGERWQAALKAAAERCQLVVTRLGGIEMVPRRISPRQESQ